jgi:hypothetical protein
VLAQQLCGLGVDEHQAITGLALGRGFLVQLPAEQLRGTLCA